MEEEEGLNWDEELERRIEFLKCKSCGGTNPYVCACAKATFLKKKESKVTELDIRKAFLCSECGSIRGTDKCGCPKKMRKLI
jgi:translation initiation factor 2 beta subunit (eIF-2beta)/eIF-5